MLDSHQNKVRIYELYLKCAAYDIVFRERNIEDEEKMAAKSR